MDRRNITIGFLLMAIPVGTAAMTEVGATVFPHHENLIFWGGFGLVALSLIAFVPLIFWPTGSQNKLRPPTVSALAEGNGTIVLEDSHSTAHVLAHARDHSSITGRNITHDPKTPDSANR